MSKLDLNEAVNASITFMGEDVRKILEANREVMASIWQLCAGLLDTSTVVYVSPRDGMNFSGKVEWHATVTSPKGRRTILIKQFSPGSPVRFENE